MARILITSGPTRQYFDPVRYLTNASSGRMGKALAEASLQAGHKVVIVSGPVEIQYPDAAEVVSVISTEEMLKECLRIFPTCDGVIGVAAPCDYRPEEIKSQKISKTGQPLTLSLIETTDVIATLGSLKTDKQWVVGFALETNDQRFRALVKLEKKSCDLMVLNGTQAMGSSTNNIEILDPQGTILQKVQGPKETVAKEIMKVIENQLIQATPLTAR